MSQKNKRLIGDFLELTSTNWFDEICKRGSDGTTQRIRLQKDKFFNQSIHLPQPAEQQGLLKKIQTIRADQFILHKQTIDQQAQVKQLKQAILQEAIQGKLTADWRAENPDAEPASKLLKCIKAEKQKLIDEKKIRKEKPLPAISAEEIPFDLPAGWVWCRLGEAILYSDSGKSPNCEKRPVSNNEWGVLTTTSIQNGFFDETINKVLPTLPEQTAIVQKVEALMQTCIDLEIQIKQSETHSTQLMQAVIKEAFAAENTSTTP